MATTAKTTTLSTKQILEHLATMSDHTVDHDRITRKGKEFVLPATMTLRSAVAFVNDYYEQMTQVRSYTREFQYLPDDGAVAFSEVLLKVTGAPGLAQARETFFGSQPPEMREVEVGHGRTVSVPWGSIYVPMMNATFEMQQSRRGLFLIYVEAQAQHADAIYGLFNAIEAHLQTTSIYRGQAFDGAMKFLDTNAVDPDNVIYSGETQRQLDTHIWSPIKHTHLLREAGLPLKRAVLLHGPFGTGKTLAAMLTAQICEQNGWTFVYCRPQDDIDHTLTTARLYEPAVVFIEDADERTAQIAARTDGRGGVSKLLDMFDGIGSKSSQLQIILTTNYPERIEKGMIRPGRLDALVEIGKPDKAAITRFVQTIVPPDRLDPSVNYDNVAEAMSDYLPAFIKEAIDRSVRYAIATSESLDTVITTEHLTDAAAGLRPQFNLMNQVEAKPRPALDAALAEVVNECLHEAGDR